MGKRCVGILFGGRSTEHEISLRSARNILRAIDRKKYDILLIAIDRTGRFGLIEEEELENLFQAGPEGVSGEGRLPSVPSLSGGGKREPLPILPGAEEGRFLGEIQMGSRGKVDVVFPVLHGTFGEDGTVQGLLKLVDVAYVGSGVLGSAATMDKDVMKRLLREASIPVPKFLVYGWNGRAGIRFNEVRVALGLPLFVKPANLGSSVGISKVKTEKEFAGAVDLAFRFDGKIIVEEAVKGREIECSVLGNENPLASTPGEVKPLHEFYSYEAKYIDEKGAVLEIPARVTEAQKSRIQELAVRSFRVLCCEGMARADFFLTEGGEVLVNELNTIPGFTDISMYPKLWEESGISQTELIDRLIQLALARHEREKKLQTRYLG